MHRCADNCRKTGRVFTRLAAIRLTILWSASLLTVIGAAACGTAERNASATNPPTIAAVSAAPLVAGDTDDFGRPWPSDTALSARVVSLIPAATEVVFAIGRGSQLVGRVTWDVHPDSARAVPNVGDGIRPNIEAVLARKPTLVILFATAENRDAADALARAGVATVAMRIVRIADFARATQQLGRLFNAPARAATVIDSVERTLSRVRDAVRGAPRPSIVWPFWHAPVLVAGRGGFESELIDIAGGRNVFDDRAESSVQVTLEDIAHRNPDMILVGPAGAEHIYAIAGWQAVRAARDGHFGMLDTIIMGRPAVSIGMEAVSLARLLHPERTAALR